MERQHAQSSPPGGLAWSGWPKSWHWDDVPTHVRPGAGPPSPSVWPSIACAWVGLGVRPVLSQPACVVCCRLAPLWCGGSTRGPLVVLAALTVPLSPRSTRCVSIVSRTDASSGGWCLMDLRLGTEGLRPRRPRAPSGVNPSGYPGMAGLAVWGSWATALALGVVGWAGSDGGKRKDRGAKAVTLGAASSLTGRAVALCARPDLRVTAAHERGGTVGCPSEAARWDPLRRPGRWGRVPRGSAGPVSCVVVCGYRVRRPWWLPRP